MNPFDVRFIADRLLEASIEVKPSEWYTTDLHRGHIVLHGFDRISLSVFICFANMQIWKASHAVHALGYHLIFCPKYRHQVLEGAIEVELKRIFAETCKTYGWELHSCEVMPDHCHLFVQADHMTAPGEIVKTLKSISAVYIFTKFPDLKKRKFWGSGLWSPSKALFSVGHISEEAVKRYIETQKQRG